MPEKHLFFCPSCKSWYSCAGANARHRCEDCGGTLVPTDIDYQKWGNMSQEQKERIKQEYANKPASTMVPPYDGAAEDENSVWMTLLSACGWIGVVACAVAGLIGAGFIGLALGTLGGLLGASLLMVVVGMARDVRRIRVAAEKAARKTF